MSHAFPTPSPADWRAEAEKALKGKPLEGLVHLDADHLTTRPLYGRANATEAVFAPRASNADGRAWDLRTQVEGDEPEGLNAAVLDDLEGGAASVLLSGAVLAVPESAADGTAASGRGVPMG